MFQGPGGSIDLTTASIVAAADGSYKSRIPNNAGFVTVTAFVTDANDWVLLPSGVPIGWEVRGWSAVAHEIRTDGGDLKINNVDSDGTQEAAIPTGGRLWTATYVNATIGWILVVWTNLGAVVTAIVPD